MPPAHGHHLLGGSDGRRDQGPRPRAVVVAVRTREQHTHTQSGGPYVGPSTICITLAVAYFTCRCPRGRLAARRPPRPPGNARPCRGPAAAGPAEEEKAEGGRGWGDRSWPPRTVVVLIWRGKVCLSALSRNRCWLVGWLVGGWVWVRSKENAEVTFVRTETTNAQHLSLTSPTTATLSHSTHYTIICYNIPSNGSI